MKNILVVLLLLILTDLSGQKTSICSYYGDNAKYHNSEICGALSFTSNREAEDAVDNILSQVGLKRNFVVMECPEIENAIAINIPSDVGMLRYIAYDRKFLNQIDNSTSTDWASISILAHEVGHHLNGHTLDGSGSTHRTELEADEFSGFVLAKLGATLEQAQSAIILLASDGDDTYSSHPSRFRRLDAIKDGFINGGGRIEQKSNPTNDRSKGNSIPTNSNSQSANSPSLKDMLEIPRDKPTKNPRHKPTTNVPATMDTDDDGIEDTIDLCPYEYGSSTMKGCPDSDNDNIPDYRDDCPEIAGTYLLKGCPEDKTYISSSDADKISEAMRAIKFKTGTADLKPESLSTLNTISQIMKKYPSYNLIIEGHTDNYGNAVKNQLLSEQRARACYTYLIDIGLSQYRMTHSGFGEARPIGDNDTANGRKENRRVAFSLVPK